VLERRRPGELLVECSQLSADENAELGHPRAPAVDADYTLGGLLVSRSMI
jgi:hypothetical protein